MPKNVRSRNLFITDKPGQAMPDVIASIVLGDTDRGFLPNRLTTEELDTMDTGALVEGAIAFNTDYGVLQIYNGDGWVGLGDWSATQVRIDVPNDATTNIIADFAYTTIMLTDGEGEDASVVLVDGIRPGQRAVIEVSFEDNDDSVTMTGDIYDGGAASSVVFDTDGGFIFVEWDAENGRWTVLQSNDVTINTD